MAARNRNLQGTLLPGGLQDLGTDAGNLGKQDSLENGTGNWRWPRQDRQGWSQTGDAGQWIPATKGLDTGELFESSLWTELCRVPTAVIELPNVPIL